MSFNLIFSVECPPEENQENKKMILDLFKRLGVNFDDVAWTTSNHFTLSISNPETAANDAKLYFIEGGKG